MSNYTQITFFAPKDALLSGNPAKLIKGADVDPELAAISVAIASKYDSTNFAFATPTGTIGLSAVNGTSNNPMRSDAAPALSQAISPTWSGTHTFSNAITVNGGGSSIKGGVTIAAPSSGTSLTVNALDGTNAVILQGGTPSNGFQMRFLDSASVRGLIGYGPDVVVGGALTDFGVIGNNALFFSANGGASKNINISSAGNVAINAPSSGGTLILNGIASSAVQILQLIGGINGSAPLLLQDGQTGARQWQIEVGNPAVGNFRIRDATAGADRIVIGNIGNVTINAPSSSSPTLSVNGTTNDSIYVLGANSTGNSFGVNIQAGSNSSDRGLLVQSRAGAAQFQVRGDGVIFGNDGTSLFELGYKDVPQNIQNAGYTTVLSDRGKHIYFNSVGTFTIAANASVAYPSGTVLTFYNATASNCSIAINSDTMTLAGTSTTGTRTLASGGLASALKTSTTGWVISGSGLS